MNLKTFLAELKRRRVVRVAVVYAVVAFVVVQVADLLVPALLLPDWALRLVALLLILGFPVALVLAWAFDLTPEGVLRAGPVGGTDGEDEPDQPPSGKRRIPRTWIYGGVAGMAGVALLLLALRTGPEPAVIPDEGPRPPPSVAVLPFLNWSPDPDQEYFSDGITEDLITSLSRIEGLRVPSRTSVMRFKGSDLPLQEIARELGVTHLLEGSVRREEGQVRINAQLIDAERDDHVWADIYDREVTGIFQIQSEITYEISQALARHLSPTDRERIADGGTESLTAYDLLLRGREYLNRPGEADLQKYAPAIGFFHQAAETDPGYARAYVGLSEAYRRFLTMPLEVRQDSAMGYARRAIELDPSLAEARAALGLAYLFVGTEASAEEELHRALRLDPNQADAMAGMAQLALLNGRFDEAVRWQARSVEVDPFSAHRLSVLGQYRFDLGDLTGAEEAFIKAVELSPDLPEAAFLLALIHLIRGEEAQADRVIETLAEVMSGQAGGNALLGRYYAQRGEFERAGRHLERLPDVLGAFMIARAYLLERMGEEERARAIARDLERRLEAAEETPPARARVDVHALLGNLDVVLPIVEEHWRTSFREGGRETPPQVGIYWLDHDFLLERFRDDARFQGVLQSIRAELDSMRALVVPETR